MGFVGCTDLSSNQRSLFAKTGAHKDLHLVPGPTVPKGTAVRLDWLSSKLTTGIFALWALKQSISKKNISALYERIRRTLFSM